ncbi:MAG: PadR family transcriptional regulator [Bacteroidetes bacterium]|nr:MAG: PadR family transcriptional regulator [Cryomorphaceae bacterium BACL29 MAG-121220-bin8]MDA0757695.1 PadR family transcriptional regulator [Bacteroidota bacterium]MDA1018839.1 PadR family transcriptional regulator [Bacteroidota bacterium]
MSINNFKIQIRKGLLEFCILQIISRNEVYTSDIIEELKNSKIIVVEGTVYPLLNRLKISGYIKHEWKESTQGPPRKYYSITETGINYIKDLIISWNEINSSVKKLLNIKNSNE